MNHKGYFLASKIAMLLVANFSLPMASYFVGYDSGLHYFYTCFIAVVIILFPHKQYVLKGTLLALPVCLSLSERYYRDTFFAGVANLPPEFLDSIFYCTIFFNSAILAFVMFTFSLTVDTFHFQIMKDEEDRIESSKLEALAVLSAGVAHEINNPLAIISSRSDQLMTLKERGKLDEEKVQSIAENIKKHTLRISKIISGLRSFSRSSKDEIPSPVSLRHILSECSELFPQACTSGTVQLSLEDFEDIQIICRPVQIMQVIINLVNNACDEIQNQENPWIKISVSRSKELATIRVTDCGKGIDPKIAKKIMQPFFTTKEVGKGTGLGLSISTSIMEKQSGRLYIDHASPNTCFAVEIPYLEEGSDELLAG